MKNTIKNNTKTQLTIADATYEGGKKTLTGTVAADVFIVPNKALNMKGYCFVTDSRIKNLGRILVDNDLSFDFVNDKTVELWYVTEDSDNVCDHGFSTSLEDGRTVCTKFDISHLPIKMFEGKQEGDVVELKIHSDREVRIFNKDSREYVTEKMHTNITFNLRLTQKGYRYERFGSFEDVLKQVQ
jgi:hypothetical protein